MTSDPEQEGAILSAVLRKRRRRRLARIIILLALLSGAASLYWMRRAPAPGGLEPEAEIAWPPPPALPSPPPPPERVVPPPPPSRQGFPARRDEPLPELDQSDAFLREKVRSLSPRRQLASWLDTDGLARRFVVAIDNLAEGLTPAKHWSALRPPGRFSVIREPDAVTPEGSHEERYRIDPASFARYDPLVDVLVTLDVERTVALYRGIEPLLDQAYRELGYPDGRFRNTLFQAIDELLRTPTGVGADEVALRRKVLGYAYVDPELEGLSAAQKQLLRTGPGNVPRVQRKLRQFARALGERSSELPNSPRYRHRAGTGPTP